MAVIGVGYLVVGGYLDAERLVESLRVEGCVLGDLLPDYC